MHRPAVILLICLLAASPAFARPRQAELARSEASALEAQGDVLMARKKYREAMDSYTAAINLDPKNAVTWNKRGIAHQLLFEDAAAKKDYEKAIHLNRRYSEAINNLGTIYFSAKNYKRAASLYKQATEIAPSSVSATASAFSNLGTALFARQKLPEASAAFQKALQLDPEVFDHRNSYGLVSPERSAQESAMFHFIMARTYATANNQDKTMEHLRKAMEGGFRDTRKIYSDSAFTDVVKSEPFAELLRSLPE